MKEYHWNWRICRVWIHPEFSTEWLRFGIQLDKQGCLEINLIWYHINFMYY